MSVLAPRLGGTGISSPGRWSLLFGNQNSTMVQLPIGSSGQFLKVNSSGEPAWSGVSPGSSQWTTDLRGNFIPDFPAKRVADGEKPWKITEEDAQISVVWVDDLSAESPSIPEDICSGGWKVTTTASGSGKYIEFALTLSEHELASDNDVYSAGCFVYQDTSTNTITLELNGASTGSMGTDSASVADSWEPLAVENKSVSASETVVRYRLKVAANSAVFYVALPMFNVGSTVLPFAPNPTVNVSLSTEIINDTTPPTSETDYDCTGDTHPRAVRIGVRCVCVSDSTADRSMIFGSGTVALSNDSSDTVVTFPTVMLDEDGVFQYRGSHSSGYNSFQVIIQHYEMDFF